MTPASVPLVMLYSPFPTLAEAQQAARQLLAEKLIACANILPAGISMYVWENMLHESPETVLLAKTTPSMADRAVERLLALHPYTTPAVLRWQAMANASYSQWVNEIAADATAPLSGH